MRYYTPTIEEFQVGFEYEVFQKGNKEPVLFSTFPIETEDKWYGYTFPDPFLGFRLDKMFETYILRVKYLDEQDIKELGWVQDENYPTQYYLKETDFVWTLVEFDDFINIETSSRHVNFNVTIKNKSELKKLMSQLGIVI